MVHRHHRGRARGRAHRPAGGGAHGARGGAPAAARRVICAGSSCEISGDADVHRAHNRPVPAGLVHVRLQLVPGAGVPGLDSAVPVVGASRGPQAPAQRRRPGRYRGVPAHLQPGSAERDYRAAGRSLHERAGAVPTGSCLSGLPVHLARASGQEAREPRGYRARGWGRRSDLGGHLAIGLGDKVPDETVDGCRPLNVQAVAAAGDDRHLRSGYRVVQLLEHRQRVTRQREKLVPVPSDYESRRLDGRQVLEPHV